MVYALADHYLDDAFLHQALGLRLGVEGHNLDLTLFSGLLHRLPGRRSVIRIERDEPGQVGILFNGGLGVAQSDLRLDIVIQHLDHFKTGAFQCIHHAGNPVLRVLGGRKAHQTDDCPLADDLQRRFGRCHTGIIV